MAAAAGTRTDGARPAGRTETTTTTQTMLRIGGLGAVTGVAAATIGALIGGGGRVPIAAVVGALAGAAVAVVAALLLRSALVPPAPTPTAGGLDGDVDATRAPAGMLALGPPADGPAVSRSWGRSDGNLQPLVTAVGRRFLALSERQLVALGADGTPDDLDGARRLALRSQRAASTLVVLADPEHESGAEHDATLGEIIDLALADSDHRTQVDTSSVHPARVDGSAVPDLVHLLAELIDNAVVASADPRTTVAVLGRRARDGYVLSVVDEGVGMAPTVRDASNGLLASPPELSAQQADALGLSVVGRLAARHGIGVTLLESATDGIIAKIRVPARLLDGGTVAGPTPYERTLEVLEAARLRPGSASIEDSASTGTSDADPTEPTVIDLTDGATAEDAEPSTADADDNTAGPRTITRPMKNGRPARR